MAKDLAKLKRTIEDAIKADRDAQKAIAAAEGAAKDADADLRKLVAALKNDGKDVSELD